jgi:hypothetical protein
VAVSFIVGGNRSTRRKPSILCKSLTNFITKCCIEFFKFLSGHFSKKEEEEIRRKIEEEEMKLEKEKAEKEAELK